MSGKYFVRVAMTILLAVCPSVLISGGKQFPTVMKIRDRAATVDRITAQRLDELLPRVMRESGIDMWIMPSNEDNYDPVFSTMVPYDAWCPITQILVLYDPGPGKKMERLSVARTNMKGLHEKAWDSAAWDREKKESQRDCLARIVRERDPKTIGINESEVIWAADGLDRIAQKKTGEDHRAEIRKPPRIGGAGLHPLVGNAAR